MAARLTFDNVTIQYPVFNSRNMSLRNHLIRISTGGRIEKEAGHTQIVTALKDASFDIREGDAVGLVGHNGAGKSTLLRTMAGVYTPVQGTVNRLGRIATMLDIGAGMDPELSGYENITRMSMLLGLNKSEIQANLKDIEEFTELGDFLNLPVRTYSAGMGTRLMFAVATSTKPDILLVDEMFGTGDSEFQEKARERMIKLIRSVGIFVFASHSLDVVRQYCNRFFQLEHGTVREISRDAVGKGTD
ncbi:MAG: ABC transporter ATP-binding protein [Alphaproteobacteria bacterium]|nr:ABC transporter ATP-binding protein [Alphaproteobacteria bacterium]MBV8549044.1 ABC transporter ATP-binding protein [Alphaproteobacteria bacterium]